MNKTKKIHKHYKLTKKNRKYHKCKKQRGMGILGIGKDILYNITIFFIIIFFILNFA